MLWYRVLRETGVFAMGLLDGLFGGSSGSSSSSRDSGGVSRGIVDYGEQKKEGGHDHRYNRGDDRTPAQKSGDAKRKK
jgi:hypothetical protein